MEQREVKVCGVMTAGRYENSWARNKIENAFKACKIPLNISGGVFYGQCMQMMLEDLVRIDCDYAITVDWDSVFTADDIHKLLSYAVQCDDIDAITGVQVRRGKADTLATAFGQTELKYEGKPLRISTAHFGLTVIDLHKLRDIPKPWFWSQPNSEGCWTGEKIDDDVYFWKQWEKHGRTLYLDPSVRLGHLEEVVTIHDENLRVVQMYPADWSEQYES